MMSIYFYMKTSVWTSSAMIASEIILILFAGFAIDVDNRTDINFILSLFLSAVRIIF